MSRLRIGVIGAGMISQVEHIPNILHLPKFFELIGVADPSAVARSFIGERYGVATWDNAEQLIQMKPDAVLIAAPDFWHAELVLRALSLGLHVFCEKPLCYGPTEVETIRLARDRAARVVQVGYMKRFDPSYEAALELLPPGGKGLRYISVEVNDPDAWPFVAHHPHVRATDLPASLIEEGRHRQQQQVAAAVGPTADTVIFRGFVSAYCSSLVHDVNAVHGMLDRMGVVDGEVCSGELFASGDGGSGTVRLLGGQASWHMVHLTVPHLADYRERIALYFDDWMLELIFPSPWLNHQPTELLLHRSDGLALTTSQVRVNFEEAYLRELEGFWSSIVNGAPVRNTVEQALRDQQLLCAMAERAMSVTRPA
jgi:predicted dehydrogenase